MTGDLPHPYFYFNPRTPCGVRPAAASATCGRKIFQSTHPLRGATVEGGITVVESWLFQSTHPLRGATPPRFLSIGGKPFQSTHPLRGATRWRRTHADARSKFQSTHPLRGATCWTRPSARRTGNFNPRTPCGVRLYAGASRRCRKDISIHAPLAGCDGADCICTLGRRYFNPRTPCGVRQKT